MNKIREKGDQILQWANDNGHPKVVELMSAYSYALSEYIDEIVGEKILRMQLAEAKKMTIAPLSHTKKVMSYEHSLEESEKAALLLLFKITEIEGKLIDEVKSAGDEEAMLWLQQYKDYKWGNVSVIIKMIIPEPYGGISIQEDR